MALTRALTPDPREAVVLLGDSDSAPLPCSSWERFEVGGGTVSSQAPAAEYIRLVQVHHPAAELQAGLRQDLCELPGLQPLSMARPVPDMAAVSDSEQ